MDDASFKPCLSAFAWDLRTINLSGACAWNGVCQPSAGRALPQKPLGLHRGPFQ